MDNNFTNNGKFNKMNNHLKSLTTKRPRHDMALKSMSCSGQEHRRGGIKTVLRIYPSPLFGYMIDFIFIAVCNLPFCDNNMHLNSRLNVQLLW